MNFYGSNSGVYKLQSYVGDECYFEYIFTVMDYIKNTNNFEKFSLTGLLDYA